jgi:hypothetical protein
MISILISFITGVIGGIIANGIWDIWRISQKRKKPYIDSIITKDHIQLHLKIENTTIGQGALIKFMDALGKNSTLTN